MATIRHKRWKVKYVKLPKTKDGDVTPPGEKPRIMRIADRLLRRPAVLLETLIHEAIHAGLPDLTEDTVDEVAYDIARLLVREGFWLKEAQ
jgi:hypothetical protein